MAEATFRALTTPHTPHLIHRIDSCGTGAYHAGDPPDSRTLSTLADNGITTYTHAARIITPADFSTFDYILAMDRDNLRNLQWMQRRGGGASSRASDGTSRANRGSGGASGATGGAKVMLFGAFGGKSKGEEVIDPYYGANDGFEIAYEQMVRFSRGFVEQVLGEEVGREG